MLEQLFSFKLWLVKLIGCFFYGLNQREIQHFY